MACRNVFRTEIARATCQVTGAMSRDPLPPLDVLHVRGLDVKVLSADGPDVELQRMQPLHLYAEALHELTRTVLGGIHLGSAAHGSMQHAASQYVARRSGSQYGSVPRSVA